MRIVAGAVILLFLAGPNRPNAQELSNMLSEQRDKVVQVVVQSAGQVARGSGVWVADSYVATCFHVVNTTVPALITIQSTVDHKLIWQQTP
jgi:hypothetical protein